MEEDELEWVTVPSDEEGSVLTSVSAQCLQEDCLNCPGVFKHSDAGDEMVFCVHVCHKVGAAQ